MSILSETTSVVNSKVNPGFSVLWWVPLKLKRERWVRAVMLPLDDCSLLPKLHSPGWDRPKRRPARKPVKGQ